MAVVSYDKTEANHSIVNSLFSVTASCGKTLIIFVIWGREILHVPSNLLLCCLAISDLVVGLISQPASSFYRHQRIWPSLQCCENVLFSCSGWLFSGVSLFTVYYQCGQISCSQTPLALHSSCDCESRFSNCHWFLDSLRAPRVCEMWNAQAESSKWLCR